jgi:hypothetical protein
LKIKLRVVDGRYQVNDFLKHLDVTEEVFLLLFSDILDTTSAKIGDSSTPQTDCATCMENFDEAHPRNVFLPCGHCFCKEQGVNDTFGSDSFKLLAKQMTAEECNVVRFYPLAISRGMGFRPVYSKTVKKSKGKM